MDNKPLQRNAWVAFSALVASSGTLICCVLPAVMVSLGAGATLAGLITQFPQLIWLSSQKPLVFGIAFSLLFMSGVFLYNARRLPCPTDPQLAKACGQLRKISHILWFASLALTSLGAIFAFVLPNV